MNNKKAQKLAFLVDMGQAMQAYSVPCWWVGWWLWRGLYLARHLFSLFVKPFKRAKLFSTISNLAKSKKTMGHARDYLKGHLVKQK